MSSSFFLAHVHLSVEEHHHLFLLAHVHLSVEEHHHLFLLVHVHLSVVKHHHLFLLVHVHLFVNVHHLFDAGLLSLPVYPGSCLNIAKSHTQFYLCGI